jgi:hypothetical protein
VRTRAENPQVSQTETWGTHAPWARSNYSHPPTLQTAQGRARGLRLWHLRGSFSTVNSQLNPYASFLGGADPLNVIAATPSRLATLANKLSPDGIETSLAPGKWTARQILCHLADCELVFGYRLRQTLAEDHHVIQTFDQDRWAATYAAYGAAEALNVFSSLRRWNLTLIRRVPQEQLAKPVNHPERGEMTFRVIVETMGGHDLNHIKQIEAIAALR